MNSKQLLGAVVLVGLALNVTAFAAGKAAGDAKAYHVYFGTYTKGKSKGIYRSRLDVGTGKLSPIELAAECPDPSFLAVHPTQRFLLAIDEGSNPTKTPGRGVSSFALDQRTGALTLLNSQTVGGPGPCHVEMDRTGRSVLIANYGGGSIAALPLAADGRLGAANSVMKHTGSSVHPSRQKGPHAHVATVSPDNRFVLSADLGLDKVLVYRLDAATATLSPNEPPFAALPPGSGPRHVAFHSNGKVVYVINELLCTMAVFAYDPARGSLKELQVVSTLPTGESVQPGFSTAELAVHPSGKFLYGSNRGHHSIVAYAIDGATGKLTLIGHQSTHGRTPRHFALDPTGAWLLAENQDSDNVVVFRVDGATGRLTPTGQTLEVPAPVCAVFVAAK